jgi:GNAT superfamily N-acetyltransferase
MARHTHTHPGDSSRLVPWRDEVREDDRQRVHRLVASTGFFTPAEQDIAVELVDETLEEGEAAGYQFIFADAGAPDATDGWAGISLRGYACFGPIPSRPGSYDLYWIAVAPSEQRHGLGKQLIEEAERRAMLQGAGAMFIDTSGKPQYEPTRAFYERMGYSRHEVVCDFYAPGDDKVVYRKQLILTG